MSSTAPPLCLIILCITSTMLSLLITFVATTNHIHTLSSIPHHHHSTTTTWKTPLPASPILRASKIKSSPIANINDHKEEKEEEEEEVMTLRKFLLHPEGYHLAMAPAFFGFYAYFGALAALEEDVAPSSHPIGIVLPKKSKSIGKKVPETLLKSVAGASAGAIAAILLSVGASPRRAAEFASTLDLMAFADPIGVGGIFKGDLFEELMRGFLEEEARMQMEHLPFREEEEGNNNTEVDVEASNYIRKKLRVENSVIPVAVTGFDLLQMKGKVLKSGCMARAARASATFPGLFQPVGWREEEEKEAENNKTESFLPPSLLIDGGIADVHGLVGLSSILPHESNKRVVNLVTGSFLNHRPPGPSDMQSFGVNAKKVASISIQNTPQCGPWAMQNGPRAVEAARRAIHDALDRPMERGVEDGHYELHIDASEFIPN